MHNQRKSDLKKLDLYVISYSCVIHIHHIYVKGKRCLWKHAD